MFKTSFLYDTIISFITIITNYNHVNQLVFACLPLTFEFKSINNWKNTNKTVTAYRFHLITTNTKKH